MLEIDKKKMGFKIRSVYFVDHPYDVNDVDWLDFIHLRNKVDAPGFERQEWSNAIVHLSEGQDTLWNNMASKCRADIRKAEKEDVAISVNADFSSFIELNESFRKAKHLQPNYVHILHEPLPDYCALFNIRYKGEIVAGLLFLRDENEMYGLLSASKRLEVRKEETAVIARANRLLWWEAAKWGVENGLSVMDMGNCPPHGTDIEREGLTEFKIRFGATPTPCYVYRKLYTRRVKMASKLGEVLRSMRNIEPQAKPCETTSSGQQ